MTDAPEVEVAAVPVQVTENVSEPVVNNCTSDGPTELAENSIKETLISDISQETFPSGFEFSVTVEAKSATENEQFEREITIPGSKTTENEEQAVETVLQHIVNTSPIANSLVTQEEEESSFIFLPSVPGTEATTSIKDDSVKQEPAVESSDQASKTIAESEEKTTSDELETPTAVEESPEKPIDLTPAQHGPSTAEVIRASPEPVLIVPTEEPSKPHTSPPITPEVTRKSTVPSPERAAREEQPQSRTSTLTGSEEVSSNGPVPKPVSSTTSAASEQTRTKKKTLFHFKMRPLKKAKSEAHPPPPPSPPSTTTPTREGGGDALVVKSTAVPVASDSTGSHKFTANVKKAFGNLKRTMSLHPKTGAERQVRPAARPLSRPVRPPPPWREDRQKGHVLRKHSSLQELDQPSVVSVTRPSLPGTPQLSKRQRLQEALPYFDKAMPSEITAPDVRTENAILGQVAASIAHPRPQIVSQTSESAVPEEHVQPIMVQRSASISDESGGGALFKQSNEASAALRTRPVSGGLRPKPPRPQSPPLLSPLDYQHFNDTPGQPDLTTQRIALLNEIKPVERGPGSLRAVHTSGIVQVKRPQYQYKTDGKAISVDFSQEGDYSQGSPTTLRRTQTLRTDYASLIRERVRSLRVEPSSQSAAVKPLKVRPKAVNYVCSDTIKLPKFNLKLKRRQTVPPKTVHAMSAKDKIRDTNQPETRVTSFYHPIYGRRDSPESDLHSDYVVPNQVGALQSSPLAVRRQISGNFQNGTNDIKCPQTTRQITSLQSVGMTSVMQQQQTYVMDSPERGLYLNYPQTVQTTQTIKSLELPFFADPLLSELGTASDTVSLDSAMRESHSFMSNWDRMSPKTVDEAADQAQLMATTKQALTDYLNVCVRLRSVDLQGQFAPIHYPMPWFDLKRWPKHGQVVDWSRVLILQQPNKPETAYVYLDQNHAKEENFIYSERPLDMLLTNWLDCHHTAPPVTNLECSTTRNPRSILHPVLIASTLNDILAIKPYGDESRNRLMNICFQLAAVLSYADCSALLLQQSDGVTMEVDRKKVLVVMSSTNCLVLWHYGPVHDLNATAEASDSTTSKPTPDEHSEKSETDILLRLAGAEQSTVKQIIDDLIEDLYKQALDCVKETGGLPNLMNSVAPPDWIAMMLARVIMSKCP